MGQKCRCGKTRPSASRSLMRLPWRCWTGLRSHLNVALGKDPCLNWSVRLLTGCSSVWAVGQGASVPCWLGTTLSFWPYRLLLRAEHSMAVGFHQGERGVCRRQALRCLCNHISEVTSLQVEVSHCAQPVPKGRGLLKDVDSKSWPQRGLTTRSCKDWEWRWFCRVSRMS